MAAMNVPLTENERAIRLHTNPVAGLIFFILLIASGLISLTVYSFSEILGVVVFIMLFFFSYIIASATKIASQWEKAVVLRLGKFSALKGPGIFFLIPIVDSIAYWIDVRTMASTIKAEQTLTKDNVAVDIDAIIFWKVTDAEKAAMEVVNYTNAVNLAAQTALRDTIGKTELANMLTGRESIDQGLKEIIDTRTSPWGVEVISVEIKDVVIPQSLQNAMSMQAQAERERQARVILGDSEHQIAQKFVEAAKIYEEYPAALHLRAMNMLYEGLKEKGAMMIVPSSALDTMNIGALSGLASQVPTPPISHRN